MGYLSYASLQDRVEQMLQDTTNATYDTTELGYWIEDGLKEYSTYDPHIIPVIFKIESRYGTDDTGTASSLTDTVKDQFLSTDPTNEKVVHNITDNTFAVVLTHTSAEVLTLSADIMDENEQYRIYNKRCWNKKQIYIGDVTDYLEIDSVEYPIGTKRNWKIYDEVLEIDVDSVDDSDSTLSTLGNIDVLVRFAKVHKLSQLTDWAGEVNNGAGYSAGDTSMVLDGLQTSGTIEAGEEFHLENKRWVYTITQDATIADSAATITFFPGLEDAVVDNDDITFRKNTLKPDQEELLCHLVAARAVLSDNIRFIERVNLGGRTVWSDYRQWAEMKLAETLNKMRRLRPPITKRRYPRG